MGKPVKVIDAKEGYGMWSRTYDRSPNPVLALERRIVAARLGPLSRRCVLDVATGTGHWLRHAAARGANAFGIDLSPAMLVEAAREPSVRSRLVEGDITQLPFASNTIDIAICSFAIGYVDPLPRLFEELARVARTIIVSDLHEQTAQSGWRRAFEHSGQQYQIESVIHATAALDTAAGNASLQRQWRVAASFGEPERGIFAHAGKLSAFDQFRDTPAILCTCWSRP